MTEILLIVWLAILAVAQPVWLVFYAFTYDWRSTPLGPVWLAKGGALAVTWPTLLVDQFTYVPTWLWSYIIGPALVAGTLAWLVVTVGVRLGRGTQPKP